MTEVKEIIEDLHSTNLDMWNLEDTLRLELEMYYEKSDNNQEILKKIADVALEIRKQNVARSKYKNKICEIFDQVTFKDRKFQYYSGS